MEKIQFLKRRLFHSFCHFLLFSAIILHNIAGEDNGRDKSIRYPDKSGNDKKPD